ncbi:hypothetical protein SH501x_001783 [Pirellulaceae bacterium SH501]
MSTEQPSWYSSKIDWWILTILCVPPVAAVSVCAGFAISGAINDLLVGIAVAVFVAALQRCDDFTRRTRPLSK